MIGGVNKKSMQKLAMSVCSPQKKFRKHRTIIDQITRIIPEQEFACNNKPHLIHLVERSEPWQAYRQGSSKSMVCPSAQKIKKKSHEVPTGPTGSQGGDQ